MAAKQRTTKTTMTTTTTTTATATTFKLIDHDARAPKKGYTKVANNRETMMLVIVA